MKHLKFFGISITIFVILFLIAKYLTSSFLISYFTFFYFLIVGILAFTYKKYSNNFLEECDLIIPVYNEGKHIYKTIKSISKNKNKDVNVIIINDGSTDDTSFWIDRACEDFYNLKINVINLIENKGKKYALYRGILESRSKFFITIDSDSVIKKNSIKNILKPFNDPLIGAVAGNIRVENISNGYIPGMMDVIFVFSYEFLKSAQSKTGHVLCTPGALSAYRKSAVMPILEEWLNQKFLNEYTIIGEDRALSSLLIKNDWKVVYQSSAIAYTTIPENYCNFCKMLLRWVRGDVRENILMFPYVIKKLSFKNFKSIILFLHYVSFNIGIFLPITFIPALLINMFISFEMFKFLIIYIGIITLIWSVIPTIVYIRKCSFVNSFYSFIYGIFSLLFLSWIPIYSLFTLKNNKWLTRK